MPSTFLSLAHGLVGHVAPYLMALQVPPSGPSGGAAHPATGGTGAASGGGGLGQMPMLLLVMAAVMFFMVFGPARKQKKEAEALQKSLQKGDKVITTAQMLGTIVGIDEQFVTLEISEKVRVKFLREAIARKLDANPSTATSIATSKTAEAKK